MELEQDPISDLRILMNRELIDNHRFFQLQGIIKLMPEILKKAKKQLSNGR